MSQSNLEYIHQLQLQLKIEQQQREEEQKRRELAEQQREHAEQQREHAEQQREHAEQQREHAEQQREHAEQQRKEEQQRREHAEKQLWETTLPEYLHYCHEHLFRGLEVQKDRNSSTKGNPENAHHKIRPNKIKEWADFPQKQMEIWHDIMDNQFVTERHFTSLSTLEDYGKEVKDRMLSSELDLGYFERFTVETRVASVIKKLHENPRLREIFHLLGDVSFENHANALTDESSIVTDMSSLSLAPSQPRRSKRVAAKMSRISHPRSVRPRADQFCVYNKGQEQKYPALIIEYKAPHKVSLAHIKTGLQDMDLNKVTRVEETESPADLCRRVIAAVITQAFSYMIKGGLEYGYVCTGEAFIFLRVPDDDPSTVYYYLSVPDEDVGLSTGWTGDICADNRLHLTALGQVLAFTLRALRAPIRDLAWIKRAENELETWFLVYDDFLDKIPEKDIPSSVFKPPRSRSQYVRMSPVKTRSKSAVTSCNPSHLSLLSHKDDAGDDYNPDTPSRQPKRSHHNQPSSLSSPAPGETSRGSRFKGKSRQYCTQKCLRGLVMGGKLDTKCPNVTAHGSDKHRLNPKTLIRELDKQLSCDNPQLDSQLGCKSLHIHGTRGAFFEVVLWSHGYTFVGKGVPNEFVEGSKHEELVYSRLAPIQGISVPVVLGSLDLRWPFPYDGIADIVHMIFMSYAGPTLARKHEIESTQLIEQAGEALQAIHQLGVLHNDPIAGNMTWNEEGRQVMFIDFERATLQNGRRPLGSISPNKKQQRAIWGKRRNKDFSLFEREKRRMRYELE